MDLLELVVTERNRLVRFSIITSIATLVLAIWARDPKLHIVTPFSGSDVGNITVGHAILIGQPVVCILFFLLCAQILRYKNLVARLSDENREHLDWEFRIRNDERGFLNFVYRACEFFKWFSMIGIPAVASFFLLFSQFDLETKKKEFSCQHLFNGTFLDKRAVHKSLRLEKCERIEPKTEKDECKKHRKKILGRMPRLYQPFNFLIGLFLEILVAGAVWSMFKKYFLYKRTNDG